MSNKAKAAWYAESIDAFLASSDKLILAELVQAGSFDVTAPQRDAWLRQLTILRHASNDLKGWIALEFAIPRLGSRIDAVLICGAALVVIEFKIGEHQFHPHDFNQAWDYALDLKNFHAASHDAAIFPILLASEALNPDSEWQPPHPDGVRPPRRCNPAGLRAAIAEAVTLPAATPLDGAEWVVAPYHPTPTIIEAARALYARHTVEAISRNDAGAKNLTVTSECVESVIETAAKDRFKAIIFVTGVPGAGKTLVGLNSATRHRRQDEATHATFLSGNGPLVAVLREALTRDEMARLKSAGKPARKGAVEQKVKPFIQNVHHFRDEGLRTLEARLAPDDRVVIFDEAQRAWDLAKTADFMKRRKGRGGFDRSEPQFLIEYMDRHDDWAVIVCLVGGGQEINTGEAGISTWLDAVREHFPSWRVYISPELSDSEYAAGHALDRLAGVGSIKTQPELHLSVSMRSFRSENVSAFVKALLDVDQDRARGLLGALLANYPITLTRDLEAARQWTRSKARGSERYGLVASSGAQRLKPYAVDVRVEINPVHWFLNDADDTRSSYYLEDAATEYQIQGLELDWICMTWDADLRFDGTSWQHRSFNAKGWQNIKKSERQKYLLNAYRVLLTRARQGMVIFVPPGNANDPTRPPEYYDGTYSYLRNLGIPPIEV
jgi:hypothetical protein